VYALLVVSQKSLKKGGMEEITAKKRNTPDFSRRLLISSIPSGMGLPIPEVEPMTVLFSGRETMSKASRLVLDELFVLG
jgi:hypothetical protein